jgi:hypothetical protein
MPIDFNALKENYEVGGPARSHAPSGVDFDALRDSYEMGGVQSPGHFTPRPHGYVPPPAADNLPSLTQGTPQKQSIFSKILSPFRESDQERHAQAWLATTLAKNVPGLSETEALKHQDELTKGSGLRGIPTVGEMAPVVFAPAIVAGAMTSPLALAGGLARFALASEAISYGVNLVKDEEYKIFQHKGLDELLPESANRVTKDSVEVIDLIVKGYIAGVGGKYPKKLAEKLTKETIEKVNLPRDIFIDPARLKEELQMGDVLSKAEMDMVKDLGLTGKQYRQAVKDGLDIKIASEKIVTMQDKPWYASLKKIFGIEPVSDVVMTGSGKVTGSVRLRRIEARQEQAPREDIWGAPEEWAPKPGPEAPVEPPTPVKTETAPPATPQLRAPAPQFPGTPAAVAPAAPPAAPVTPQIQAPPPQFPGQQAPPAVPDFKALEQRYETEQKVAQIPDAKSLVESRTKDEITTKLAAIFDMTLDEYVAFRDSDPLADLPEGYKYAVADEYMADLEYAANTRNIQEAEAIIANIKEGFLAPSELPPVEVATKKESPDAWMRLAGIDEAVEGPKIADLEKDATIKRIADHKEKPPTEPLTRISLKEQKTWLLDNVAAAINDLKKGTSTSLAKKRTGTMELQPEVKNGKGETKTERVVHEGDIYTFDIPGDGTFDIIATPEALKKFQEVLNSKFPTTTTKSKPKQTSLKPSGKRIDMGQEGFYVEPYRMTRKKASIKVAKDKKVFSDGEWIGNGIFMDTTMKVTGGTRVDRPQGTIDQIITAFDAENVHTIVKPTKTFQTIGTDGPVVKLEGEGEPVYVDANLFDALYAAHPNADLVTTGKSNSLVAFREGDKYVSLLGPMDTSNIHIPEDVRTPSGEVSTTTAEPQTEYEARGKFADDPAVIEFPEIVELAKALLGGKSPSLVKHFRKSGTMGKFSTAGRITLRRDLAQDMNQAAKTLAHEIGHAVDFADETMKRGNILGHIAKLKGYLKKYIAEEPGGEGPLTQAEIKALRDEARRIKAEGPAAVDADIQEALGVSPEEVLAVLRGMDTTKIDKAVIEFIQRASTPVKKSIAKQAMQGLSPTEMDTLRSPAAPKRDKVTVEAKFRELLKKEIERRKLFERNEIMEELKAHSAEWRPFERGDAKYDKYRDSPAELYADAVSALVVNPMVLKRNAPKFYDAFFNYLSERPQTKETWEAIQERIHMGKEAVSEARIKKSYEDFDKDAEIRRRLAEEKETGKDEESIKDTLMRGLNNSNHPVLKVVRQYENDKGLMGDLARGVRHQFLRGPYTPSEIDAYLYDVSKELYEPMNSSGNTVDDLGVVGKRLHIEANRKDIFSTGGLDPVTARGDLDVLRQQWGEDRYNTVLDLLKAYRKLREELVIPVVEAGDIASPELLAAMKDREYYLPVAVTHWLEEISGQQGSKGFFKQVGTLSEQGNPIVVSILNDVQMIFAARNNIMRKETVDFLLEAGIVGKAPLRFSQDQKAMVPDKKMLKPDEEIVTIKRFGKNDYYVAPKDVADMMQVEPYKALQMTRIWNNTAQVFRELFVSSNYKWMIRNVPRDFMETVLKNPEVGISGIGKLLGEYWDTAPAVWREAWGTEREAVVQDMLRNREVTTNRIWTGFDETPTNELERVLGKYNLYRQTDTQHKLYSKFIKKFWEGQTPEQIADAIETFSRGAWDKKERLGRFSDLWGKVAGREFLRKHTNLDPDAVGDRTIERIGTPNWKARGDWQQVTNALFMFSNVGKEGLRAEAKAAKENPWAYVKVVAALTILPKLILMAAENTEDEEGNVVPGIFGLEYGYTVRGIPKYYKDHAFTIPLFRDENNKSKFLTFPLPFNQQVVGAVFAKTARGEFAGGEGAIGEVAGISPYSLHPAIGTAAAMGAYYLAGINPIDLYSGRSVVGKAEMEVGGSAAQKQIWSDAWNSLGGDLIYKIPSRYESERQSMAEKALRTFPGSMLGVFLKTSDAGVSEYIQDKLKPGRIEKKKESLKAAEFLRETAKDRDRALIITGLLEQAHDTIHAKALLKEITSRWEDPWARELSRAKNDEERFIILEMLMKEKGLQ